MTAPCDDPETLARFLAAQGLAGAGRRPLAGDASTRRYERLEPPGRAPLILMRAPHPATELEPFVRIAALLRPLGLSVPAIIATDTAAGLMIMEDFGSETFTGVLDGGADPEPLYHLATDLLITLHRGFSPPTEVAGLPVYDADAFAGQVRLLPELIFPNDPAINSEFETVWRAVLPAGLAGPSSLLLRDYHAGNLMRLPDRPGVRACGLLDFQDAGPGPAAYDLISLIEDARRDLPPGMGSLLMERYLSAFPDLDREGFRRACAVLAAVRHTRVIAVFLRLAARGRPEYLRHLPRVWRYLDRHLARPELAPVAHWFDRHLPPARRAGLVISDTKS